MSQDVPVLQKIRLSPDFVAQFFFERAGQVILLTTLLARKKEDVYNCSENNLFRFLPSFNGFFFPLQQSRFVDKLLFLV